MERDQAEQLRIRIERKKDVAKQAQVIGIASGKGGVGKSAFCVNFSLALGELGKKVLIIDLDVGMGNIEQLFGMHATEHIADALKNQFSFREIKTEVSPNLSFIAGGTGLSKQFRLDDRSLHVFLTQLDSVKSEFDFILFDFGAGASEDMLHFMLAMNRLILITTPDPTAISDSYSLMKLVYTMKRDLEISCVVNQTFNRREGTDAWQRLSLVAEKFLGASPSWLASLPRDQNLVMSVRRQRPCMLYSPKATYCMTMRFLVRAFIVQCGQQLKAKENISFSDKVKKYLHLIRRNKK